MYNLSLFASDRLLRPINLFFSVHRQNITSKSTTTALAILYDKYSISGDGYSSEDQIFLPTLNFLLRYKPDWDNASQMRISNWNITHLNQEENDSFYLAGHEELVQQRPGIRGEETVTIRLKRKVVIPIKLIREIEALARKSDELKRQERQLSMQIADNSSNVTRSSRKIFSFFKLGRDPHYM